MTVLSFTPPRSALTDSRGFVSRDWQLFLAGLFERVGGSNSMTLTELVAVVDAITRGHVIEDEGVSLPQRAVMNFAGPGVTVTDDGTKTLVTVTGGGGGGGGHVIEDEGIALPQQTTMNFVGAGVTVADAGGKTVVTIPGGGGGGGGNSYFPGGF